MQEAIDAITQTQLGATYCYICNAELNNPLNAASHYGSKRHLRKVELYRKDLLEKMQNLSALKVAKPISTIQKNTTIVREIVEPVKTIQKDNFCCLICNVFNLNEAEAAAHNKSDEHKKKKEGYCDTCDKLTTSKERLWAHMAGLKHNKKLEALGHPRIDVPYSPFDLTLSLNIRLMMPPDICKICDKKFPTIKHALDHYRTKSHNSAVVRYLKPTSENDKQSSANTSILELPKSNVTEITRPVEQRRDYGLANIFKAIECFVCNLQVRGIPVVEGHKSSFPHTYLAKLKADLVSKGIMEEFWRLMGKEINCGLCNVFIKSSGDADSHFAGSKHCKKYHQWLSGIDTTKILPETDTKWFYCKVCDVPLDCTTDAEKHYLTAGHQKKSEWYCKICRVPNVSFEMSVMHKASSSHIKASLNKTDEAVWKRTAEDNQYMTVIPQDQINVTNNDNCQNTEETGSNIRIIDINSEQNQVNLKTTQFSLGNDKTTTNDKDVKEQVFQEIDKLVKTLYYSKIVPYDVSLEYLKKINKEVENLKKKYQKKESQDMHENSAGYVEPTSEFKENLRADFEGEYFNNIPTDIEFFSLSNGNFPNEDAFSLPEFNVANEKITTKDVDAHTKEYTNSKGSYIQVEEPNKGVKKKTVKQDKIHPHNSIHLEEQDDLDTLLEKICLIKNQVEDNTEREVLSEIEKLIMLVNSDDIPPDVTLMCLQEFNRDLDKEYFNQEAEREQRKELENGIEDITTKLKSVSSLMDGID